MPKKTRPYREALLEGLSDPVEAAHYLNAAMNDSPEMFLKALRNVAQSRQMTKVARDAGVTRESLYRALSQEGNPTLGTLHSVLGALGLNIAIQANEVTVSVEPTNVPLAAVTPAAAEPVIGVYRLDIKGLNPIGNASATFTCTWLPLARRARAGIVESKFGNLSVDYRERNFNKTLNPLGAWAIGPVWALPKTTTSQDFEKVYG
jgi:probable addiction module antidote protein